MNSEWFYNRWDRSYGPVSHEDLQRLVRTGFVNRETLVWTEGWERWLPASNVPGLFASPPPLTPGLPAASPAPALETPTPKGRKGLHWVSRAGIFGLSLGIYTTLFKDAGRGAGMMLLGLILLVAGFALGGSANSNSDE